MEDLRGYSIDIQQDRIEVRDGEGVLVAVRRIVPGWVVDDVRLHRDGNTTYLTIATRGGEEGTAVGLPGPRGVETLVDTPVKRR